MNSGDTAWVLISFALVILMTPALGFFYGGMVRKKNILSTLMLSVALLVLISVQWVLFGYSLAFGPDKGGLIGSLGWFGLNNIPAIEAGYAPTIPHMAFILFQLAFAVITPALISGAFVERISFAGFLLFTLVWSTFVYAPVAHWIWGIGGWLRTMGALDFAGGAVVHITAGVSALALALVVGKRKGYGKVPMEPSNIPLTVLGAFLLWFGWFGFNGGSALSAGPLAASTIMATNTAGAAAGLTWMIISWVHKRPSVLGLATGAIVGLAAVTPASGYVSPLSAMVIGSVAAILSYYMIIFRMKIKFDESLDVFACHGVGGIWGVLATGLFAQKAINPAGANGLFFGNPGQLGIQALTALVVVVFSFVVSYIMAKIIDAMFKLRVGENEEDVGLDISQHGESAY
ncbi:ammonia channel protein [candidate division WOR-1 bacterium RIFCSPHIGHO2_01_FULL_53_15]|uniref:Ammonium transporter n=1 Tax=candidate division WOR-1 bacterium RIFCSPHIGHO2_01_FULL_53_15 TaxID=1802564 RepID=A0A1F4Q3G0_UNCSA|nr:MAG: ammonia channel protein [candidate division WOR-1 bacterium RIFCSPHIGHO2_01_FULL_53_15]OGC12823.1 MAG: ammonia channel protein [candidate division WOR-1 bacterium RIFCSPHIGHO2_02_FULL_53_26]